MTRFQKNRAEIERQLTANNIHADFSGYSDANGLSIYYLINGKKVRFSDHSVSNASRVFDEVHFDLPIVNYLGKGEVIKDLSKLIQIRLAN
jgi:N-acetylmuramoyl-L-alanine amidase